MNMAVTVVVAAPNLVERASVQGLGSWWLIFLKGVFPFDFWVFRGFRFFKDVFWLNLSDDFWVFPLELLKSSSLFFPSSWEKHPLPRLRQSRSFPLSLRLSRECERAPFLEWFV